MPRVVSRRSVVKLVYAAPVIAATMRIGLSSAFAGSGPCLTAGAIVPIVGIVTDALTGLPIADAFVEGIGPRGGDDAERFTDANGRFVTDAVIPAIFTIDGSDPYRFFLNGRLSVTAACRVIVSFDGREDRDIGRFDGSTLLLAVTVTPR